MAATRANRCWKMARMTARAARRHAVQRLAGLGAAIAAVHVDKGASMVSAVCAAQPIFVRCAYTLV